MAEGRGQGEHRSDVASHSPSFGNLSTKSPHSQHILRHSRKHNVLREYNHLFKRIETVKLKHKWETDDEDGAADVTGSSCEVEDDGAEGDARRSADAETALAGQRLQDPRMQGKSNE